MPERRRKITKATVDALSPGEIAGDGEIKGFGLRCQRRDRVYMVKEPFGGRQWYVTCPRIWKRVRVLYRPPKATFFASRHAWPRQVAYASHHRLPSQRRSKGHRNYRLSLVCSGQE